MFLCNFHEFAIMKKIQSYTNACRFMFGIGYIIVVILIHNHALCSDSILVRGMEFQLNDSGFSGFGDLQHFLAHHQRSATNYFGTSSQ